MLKRMRLSAAVTRPCGFQCDKRRMQRICSVGSALRRIKLGDEPGVGRPAHALRLGGQLVVGRLGTEAVVQLANTPKGAIVLALALDRIPKAIGLTRPKMVGAKRQVKHAATPVRARTDKPQPPATNVCRLGGRQAQRVVYLERLACFVVGHQVSKAQPTPGAPGSGFKFDDKIIIEELEAQIAGQVLAEAHNTVPPQLIDVEPRALLD